MDSARRHCEELCDLIKESSTKLDLKNRLANIERPFKDIRKKLGILQQVINLFMAVLYEGLGKVLLDSSLITFATSCTMHHITTTAIYTVHMMFFEVGRWLCQGPLSPESDELVPSLCTESLPHSF